MRGTVVITGAFSYTGKYATKLLLNRGYEVRTLTHHPERANHFNGLVQAFPYNFEQPEELGRTLHGASTVINTYWVRFPHGRSTFETAVQNTRTLIAAAKNAGVRRIVHVSIANPSLQSPLGYYRGKAELEKSVIDSGLSYAILRPTVIFGLEDILINNIAWFVRHFPVFGIPGDGQYRLRPIHVEDMARLIVNAVEQEGNLLLDAVGPESFAFEQLVKLIVETMQRRVRPVRLPVPLAFGFTHLIGRLVGDVVLTREEYRGLMSNLLDSKSASAGETRLSQWLAENRADLGRKYASEVARHFAKPQAAGQLNA